MSYSSTTSYRHQRYFCTNSLKRTSVWHGERKCLFPLRIYTALKLKICILINAACLFSLRIYTALKPFDKAYKTVSVCFPYEFTLLSNGDSSFRLQHLVCFPYEFTLLSNRRNGMWNISEVCFPYEFTLLSNRRREVTLYGIVCFPYEFTLLSN